MLLVNIVKAPSSIWLPRSSRVYVTPPTLVKRLAASDYALDSCGLELEAVGARHCRECARRTGRVGVGGWRCCVVLYGRARHCHEYTRRTSCGGVQGRRCCVVLCGQCLAPTSGPPRLILSVGHGLVLGSARVSSVVTRRTDPRKAKTATCSPGCFPDKSWLLVLRFPSSVDRVCDEGGDGLSKISQAAPTMTVRPRKIIFQVCKLLRISRFMEKRLLWRALVFCVGLRFLGCLFVIRSFSFITF
jgi:hypothetical protein